MTWLLTRIVVWPYKLAAGTTKATAKTTAGGFKAGYRTGRLLGYRRLTLLGIGIGIGLLVAPVPGRELRARLREWLEDLGGLAGFDGGEDGEDVDRWTSKPPTVTPAPVTRSVDPAPLPSTETSAVSTTDDDDVMKEITGTGPAT